MNGEEDDPINPRKRTATTLEHETDEIVDQSSRHQDVTPEEEIRLANEAIDSRHARILKEQKKLLNRKFSFNERQNAELNISIHNIWFSSPQDPGSSQQ